MTSIRGHRRLCRECTSESLSGFSSLPKSNHDETPINLLAVELLIAKYTKVDLQKILRTVLKALTPPSDDNHEKPLKAKLPDVYCSKFHMECYNFCQQCKDYFATARAKGPNRIPFAASFLYDHINFCWQQYKRKHKIESLVPIT